MGTPTVSVVIPVLNEEATIETAYAGIVEVFDKLDGRYALEILFTDNHSDDRSFEIISRLAAADDRVRGVRFARNFGFHRSILTGLRLASGDAAVQIDCDLQDPPSVIPEFIERWEQGHDVVVGVRRVRKDGLRYQRARRAFYRLIKAISNDNLVLDSGDFRLLDRSILDQLRVINEASPYIRGLTSMLAAKQTAVLYDRRERTAGRTKFPLSRLVMFALDAMLAHSVIPLRLATFLGLAISVATFLLSLFYIVGHFWFGLYWPRGFVTVAVLLLFGISLNAIFLGIIGEYVGRIYNQVRFRPTTVIERTVNLDGAQREAGSATLRGNGGSTLAPGMGP